METGITKNQIISELSRSPHGKLTEYVDLGRKAAQQEPEFFAHLIAWDRQKGQVRDAKVALPVVSLSVQFPDELASNSLAHLALLGPRELLRAYRFALELRPAGRMRTMRRLVEGYLRDRERPWQKFERTAVQHRHTMKELYALTHVKPGDTANAVLFKENYREGSVFAIISQLKNMSPVEAAAAIVDNKIPFLIASGALGKKIKEPELIQALLGRMTPTEVVTNTKMLERLGVKNNPALRGAFEAALEKASKSKSNLLKTTRAAEAIDDEELKEKLRGVQERQIQAAGGVDGNWLVLGDKSGSMAACIEGARQIAATLAKMVTGKVWLTFFDTAPQTIDVTGLALDAIQAKTRFIGAGGGTSIGCGLQRMLDSKQEIDGIAVVSDGDENNAPWFFSVYQKYCQHFGKEVPVYFYKINGRTTAFEQTMQSAKLDMQVFNLTIRPDFYSLPNLVATMRTNRYSLIDEIMATPLLKYENTFRKRPEIAIA